MKFDVATVGSMMICSWVSTRINGDTFRKTCASARTYVGYMQIPVTDV